jgi:hypothetical protein
MVGEHAAHKQGTKFPVRGERRSRWRKCDLEFHASGDNIIRCNFSLAAIILQNLTAAYGSTCRRKLGGMVEFLALRSEQLHQRHMYLYEVLMAKVSLIC